VAKSAERKPGSYPAEHAQVCHLGRLSPAALDDLLAATPVADIWGVGPRISEQLRASGITSASQLAKLDANTVRLNWSVALERTVRELQGISCIPFEDEPPPRQQIASTRSFGAPVRELEPLIQAVSEFATRASEKLRRQECHAAKVMVFIRTSPFRKRDAQYSRFTVVPLRRPCADTADIVSSAILGLQAIYQPGFNFAKAGVMLMDLQPAVEGQLELNLEDDTPTRDRARLMQAVDVVNDRFGKGTLRIGSAKARRAPQGAWETKLERRTPAYTTEWKAMPVARC
jgi:DNA polymerase V